MTKAFILFVGILILLSCEQPSSNEKKAAKTELLSSNKISFSVSDLDAEDFEIIELADTIYYLKQLYEGLQGKKIKFDQSVVSEISARIKFDFGFKQYTTDDNPASPLEFTKQSNWSSLKIIDGVIEIPEFFANSKNSKIYQPLGFIDRKQFMVWLIGEDFEEIKTESIREQTNYYEALLNEKSKFQYCCPEYIEQAEAFLRSRLEKFESIEGLRLEPIYKSLTIDIRGHLKNGKQFHRVIVEK